MTDNSPPAVVLDHGTLTTRAGLSNSDEPVLLHSQTKSLKHPICGSVINDFTAMEEMWHDIFEAIKVDPKQHRILISEPLYNDEKNRESTTEIMFETFNVPAIYLASSPALSLFNSGRTNGTVYTSGSTFGTTYVVPLHDGHIIKFSCERIPFGGDTFDRTLKNMLAERYNFIQDVKDSAIRKMKENTCYVAQNFSKELTLHDTLDYTLPDGHVVQLGEERFRCTEGLFQPTILNVKSDGIHTLIYNTIMKSDEMLRKTLLSNIVLDGGSTMFPGLAERLQKEMEKVNTTNNKVKIYGPPDRTSAVWRGGTLIANLPTFNNWITQSEYGESGYRVMHSKCF